MNVRLGFARLAKVTAILYGIVSVLIVVFVAKGQWDERERELDTHLYTVESPSGRIYEVRARNDWEVLPAAEAYDSAHPISEREEFEVRHRAEAKAAAKSIKTKPIRVPMPQYDHPRSLPDVLKSSGLAALWCGLVYAVLWAAFRGIRWVALGFMDAKGAGPSD